MTRPHAGPFHADIFDVARHAQVSVSSVSRALRGLPGVAPATRDRILAVAAELAYVASPAAVGLRSGRTGTIGIVVPFVSRWYFMRVVQGAEKVLRSAGYTLLLHSFGDAAGRDAFFQRLPLHRKVDGILLVDVALQPSEQAQLQAAGIPVTIVGGSAIGVGAVGIDEAKSVRLAVQHLAHLGHREIGMVCGQSAAGLDFNVPDQRRESFHRAIVEAGLKTTPEWVVTARWGVEGGAEATACLLCARRLPTALFAESDEIAFGALRTLDRAGLDVPGSMSVIGFDDHEMASVVDLTTVAQPVLEQGEIAASMLVEAVRGRADPFAAVTLPTRLVVRSSTASPPADPPVVPTLGHTRSMTA